MVVSVVLVLVLVSVVVSAEDNDLIKLFMVSTGSFKNMVRSMDMEMNVLVFARVRSKSVAKQLVLFDYLIHRAPLMPDINKLKSGRFYLVGQLKSRSIENNGDERVKE